MPGQAFGLHDRYHNYLRINYALPWDNSTDNAIRVLGELCQANLHLKS
jgi:DNA-binding transcriptional MocR family regulator